MYTFYGSRGNNFSLYGDTFFCYFCLLPPPGDSSVNSSDLQDFGKTAFLAAKGIMCLFVVFFAKLVNISGALFIAS